MLSSDCHGDDAQRWVKRKVSDKRITESSGLACSNRKSDHFWTLNDSGGKPRLFAFSSTGALTGICKIDEADAVDWEALASGIVNGSQRLWVADVGDNLSKRNHVTVYELNEADPTKDSQVKPRRQFNIQYADGPRDCEAVAFDPNSQSLILVTKSRWAQAGIYVLPLDESNNDAKNSENTIVLERTETLLIPLVTGLSIEPDSGATVCVNYFQAFVYPASKNQTKRFGTQPKSIDLPKFAQIEACAIDSKGKLWVTSEKSPMRFASFKLGNGLGGNNAATPNVRQR